VEYRGLPGFKLTAQEQTMPINELGLGLLWCYRESMAQPIAQIVGLIVAWNLMGAILGPVHTTALGLLYPGAQYR
jgi:hypothetical protein